MYGCRRWRRAVQGIGAQPARSTGADYAAKRVDDRGAADVIAGGQSGDLAGAVRFALVRGATNIVGGLWCANARGCC